MRYLLTILLLTAFVQLDAQSKKRYEFHIGAEGGVAYMLGDVRSVAGVGGGISVQMHSNFIGLRIRQEIGEMRGLDYTPSTDYNLFPAWVNYDLANDEPIFHNFQTKYSETSLQSIVNLLGKKFYEEDKAFCPYIFGGIGLVSYRTNVDAMIDTLGIPQKYDFTGVPTVDKAETLTALKNMMDGVYESRGFGQDPQKRSSSLVVSMGLGFKFRINSRFVLATEASYKLVSDDELDGYIFTGVSIPEAAQSKDNYTFFSLGVHYQFSNQPTGHIENEDNRNNHIIRP